MKMWLLLRLLLRRWVESFLAIFLGRGVRGGVVLRSWWRLVVF